MKKFNVLFTALLCASVMFVGCSKDDDENGGNGEGAGNGGSGVIVKSKKVAKVIETYTSGSNNSKDTTLYAYDAEGRLSKITELDGHGDNVTNITYASNKITLSGDDNVIIELKDGRAIKSVEEETSGGYQYRDEYTYSYSGNYISKTINTYTETHNGETSTSTYEANFSVEDGNLVKVQSDDDEIVNYEIGSVDNNMNIDLIYGDIADFGSNETLLCVAGDRFKKLPTKEIYKEEGYEDEVYTYTYEVNNDGYVTKITGTSDGGSTNVYEITYED